MKEVDHAISSLNSFFEISMELLYEEWKSGEYKKLSECPSYEETSTYRKAMAIMEKYYYGSNYKTTPLKECIEGHMWVHKGIKVEW